jgi:flagellar biogenesis protein FliO
MGKRHLRSAWLRAVRIGLAAGILAAPLRAAEPELTPPAPAATGAVRPDAPGATGGPGASGTPLDAPKTAAPLDERWVTFERGAVEGDSPDEIFGTEEVSEGASRILLRLVLYLAVLGGLFWLGLLALKRFVPGGRQLFASPAMEILGRSHIDPRRYVALVRVGRRLLVVGVGPDTMAPLTEIGEEAEVAELLATARPKTERGRTLFQNLFRQYLDRSDAEADAVLAERDADGLADSFSDLQARVRDLHRRE